MWFEQPFGKRLDRELSSMKCQYSDKKGHLPQDRIEKLTIYVLKCVRVICYGKED